MLSAMHLVPSSLYRRKGLFVKSCGLVIDGVNDFEFEGFGIVLVCHVACDDALE